MSALIGRPGRLGRRGLCPFCGWIGPPQLCACIGALAATLQGVLDGSMKKDDAQMILDHHYKRVAIINSELRRERESA